METRAPKDAIYPVILAGDIGVYALGREFNEAFGTRCCCVASAPIGAIAHSNFFDIKPVERLERSEVHRALSELAAEHAHQTLFCITNSDATIDLLLDVLPELPENVVSPIPSERAVREVSDKVRFAELCAEHGLSTPLQEVVNVAAGTPGPTKIPFPVVAKPAVSADYADLMAVTPGLKKVFYLEDQEGLDDVWRRLAEAGFAGDFLVQELIAGDDTQMDSLTIYIGSNGEAEGRAMLYGSAQVLLEDHAPTMLGNPVIMITRPMEGLWAKAEAMLGSIGYRGFANFDIKRRPGTEEPCFLECNPRIGRNSYYNAAAGANPMGVCVRDLVYGSQTEVEVASEKILYTLVPLKLLDTYVRDPMLLAEAKRLVKAGKVFDPQRYPADMGPRRRLDVELTERNQIRKFRQYYPQPTDTSF